MHSQCSLLEISKGRIVNAFTMQCISNIIIGRIVNAFTMRPTGDQQRPHCECIHMQPMMILEIHRIVNAFTMRCISMIIMVRILDAFTMRHIYTAAHIISIIVLDFLNWVAMGTEWVQKQISKVPWTCRIHNAEFPQDHTQIYTIPIFEHVISMLSSIVMGRIMNAFTMRPMVILEIHCSVNARSKQ